MRGVMGPNAKALYSIGCNVVCKELVRMLLQPHRPHAMIKCCNNVSESRWQRRRGWIDAGLQLSRCVCVGAASCRVVINFDTIKYCKSCGYVEHYYNNDIIIGEESDTCDV